MKCLIALFAVLALVVADGSYKTLGGLQKEVVVSSPYYSSGYNPYSQYYSSARAPYEYDLGPNRLYIPGGVYSHGAEHAYNPYYYSSPYPYYKSGNLYNSASKYAYQPYYGQYY